MNSSENFIHITDNMYQFNKEVIVKLEDVDLQKMKKISKIAEKQNQLAAKYKGFILEIDTMLYDFNKNTIIIKYKDDIYLKKLENKQFMDEQTKCLLFNQACILLKILSQQPSQQEISQKSSQQEISQNLGLLSINNSNIYLNGENEILAITFISDNLQTHSEETHTYRKTIAKLMEIIIERQYANLAEAILAFFKEQINELIQDDTSIYYFLVNYCEKYNELQQEFQEIMPTLPRELIEGWLNQASEIITDSPIQPILKNKMIDQTKYQLQARLCSSQENFDSNYFYYFDQRRLVLYREQNRNKNSIDRVNKLEKVLNLYKWISDFVEGFQLDIIPTLETEDPTEQYFILYNIEDYFSQQGNKDLVRDFRIYFSQLINKLNTIDIKEFEFNQIKKEVDIIYFHKERNRLLGWLVLDDNQILNQFINLLSVQNQGQMMTLKDLNKVAGIGQFKICYFIKERDHNGEVQVGYAVDNQGHYYKGIFDKGQLIFGEILQVSQNNQQIINYRNVSYQNKKICGYDCQKIVYGLRSQNYIELEIFMGILKDGLYQESGKLKLVSKNQLQEGKWVNGLLEGKGTLTILNCNINTQSYTKYEGNFHKGQFHDQKGKFYLNEEFTKFEIRNYQYGQQKGKAIRYAKKGDSFKQVYN